MGGNTQNSFSFSLPWHGFQMGVGLTQICTKSVFLRRNLFYHVQKYWIVANVSVKVDVLGISENKAEKAVEEAAMIMAIVGGRAEVSVEIDTNQVDQNTFMKNYQRSSCYVFWFSGSSPRPLFPKHFFMDRGVKSALVNVRGTLLPSQCF